MKSLRRQVSCRSCARDDREQLRYAAEIDEFEADRFTISQNENVLRLHVTVNKIETQQILRGREQEFAERNRLLYR